MRRLMNAVGLDRVGYTPPAAHYFAPERIEAVYGHFANQRDGSLEIANTT